MTVPATDARTRGGMSTPLTLLFAAATGLVVANLYYAQPLLHLIAEQLGVSSAAAGLIVTISQLGYAAGLLLVVPAGDLVQRRPLIAGLLVVCAAALVGVAVAPGLAALLLAVAVVGFTSVAAQVLLPLAADLAHDDQRGTVVGTIMSGLLLGILLARTVSGLVAGALGWRALFAIAAGLTLALAVVLWRALPARTRTVDSDYPAILRSVLTLLRRHRTLRVRSAYGVLIFAAFSIFWTTVAFLLAGEPYGYSTTTIGLFGLIGAAGALSASGAGRLADRGHLRVPTGLFAVALTASFAALWWGASSLAGLVIGILVLDISVQGIHVLNFSAIYALDPEARSRLNSAYLTIYFAGGAAGSLAAAWAFDRVGWSGVCALGAATGVGALALWLTVDR
jgi:predicted MFS family arabinose efflux permease